MLFIFITIWLVVHLHYPLHVVIILLLLFIPVEDKDPYILFYESFVDRWRVLLASGVILFLVLGLEKSETLFVIFIIEHYEQKEVALVSLIFSIKLLLMYCTGEFSRNASIVSYHSWGNQKAM